MQLASRRASHPAGSTSASRTTAAWITKACHEGGSVSSLLDHRERQNDSRTQEGAKIPVPSLEGGSKHHFYLTPSTDYFFRFWALWRERFAIRVPPREGKSTFCALPFWCSLKLYQQNLRSTYKESDVSRLSREFLGLSVFVPLWPLLRESAPLS